jgi:hypothetical protein
MNEPSELIPIPILRQVTIHEVNDTTMIKRSCRHEVTTTKVCGTDDDNRSKRNDEGCEVLVHLRCPIYDVESQTND